MLRGFIPAEHGLWAARAAEAVAPAPEISSMAAAHRLGCAEAPGILPHQGSNPRLLHCQADCVPLGHQGKPQACFVFTVLLLIHVYPTAEVSTMPDTVIHLLYPIAQQSQNKDLTLLSTTWLLKIIEDGTFTKIIQLHRRTGKTVF